MKEEFSRTGLIFGEEGMAKLARSRVAVFGLGGAFGRGGDRRNRRRLCKFIQH